MLGVGGQEMGLVVGDQEMGLGLGYVGYMDVIGSGR